MLSLAIISYEIIIIIFKSYLTNTHLDWLIYNQHMLVPVSLDPSGKELDFS